jgi:outer membrane protein assembly factor BamA
MHTQPGEPANGVQVDADIEAMKKLYGTRGYMAAGIQPESEMDDANATVRMVLRIEEGDIYTMGDLEFRGLDSRTTARLQDEWKLRGGDTYDSSYAGRFLEQVDKEISLMGDFSTSVRESLNKDKTVDVTLRFNPRPR